MIRMYPDYFRRISNPICLAKIRRKIKRNEYHSLVEVRADIDRVFSNAQIYNMEGSDIFNVAVYLQQLTKSKFVELSQVAAKVRLLPFHKTMLRGYYIVNFTEIKPK